MPGKNKENPMAGKGTAKKAEAVKKSFVDIPRSFKVAEAAGRIKVVKDKNGATMVQMDLEQYHRIAKTLAKAQQEATVKKSITAAANDIKEMIAGRKRESSLSDLLDEL